MIAWAVAVDINHRKWPGSHGKVGRRKGRPMTARARDAFDASRMEAFQGSLLLPYAPPRHALSFQF